MAVSISLSDISSLPSTHKKLRAYAYLRAAFDDKKGDDVRDVFDCLIPFIGYSLRSQAGNQLNIEALKNEIAKQFELSIPIFALQNFIKRVEKRQLVRFNKNLKAYVVSEVTQLPAGQESRTLDVDFAKLSTRINTFMSEQGLSTPLTPGREWIDTLVDFLKSGEIRESSSTANIRNALIGNTRSVDHRLVAKFLKHVHDYDKSLFDSVVNIFIGVLIEDFISCIQELGPPSALKDLVVVYDTPILLRLLGCSGTLLRVATLEMHRTLQDAGCQTEYFDHTESELTGILSAVLRRLDYHDPVVNETGEALARGELTIGQLRDVDASYPTMLGKLGVYPSTARFDTKQTTVAAQIDERGFQNLLKTEALKKKLGYSPQNVENDAQSLGNVMRLRGRKRVPTLAGAGFVFVTHNGFLTTVARRFVSDKNYENFGWNYAPPFFTDEQITTYVWLLTSRDFKKEMVSRELLANCYEALHPDVDWAERFINKMREFDNFNEQEIVESADQAVWFRTAKNVAEDISYGNSAILDQIPLNEILAKTTAMQEAVAREQQAVAEAEKRMAVEEAAEAARLETEARGAERVRQQGRSIGRVVSKLLSGLVFVTSVLLALFPLQEIRQTGASSYIWDLASLLFAVLSGLNLAETTPVARVSRKSEEFFERLFVRALTVSQD